MLQRRLTASTTFSRCIEFVASKMKGATRALYFALACLFFSNVRAHADDLYVSDDNVNAILKYDSNGNASIFADSNSGADRPYGLAFDSSENLFATYWGSGTIMKFDPNGDGSVFADGNSG